MNNHDLDHAIIARNKFYLVILILDMQEMKDKT